MKPTGRKDGINARVIEGGVGIKVLPPNGPSITGKDLEARQRFTDPLANDIIATLRVQSG